MREKLYGDLEFELKTAKINFCCPLTGIFELTYACSYNCVHCYCKGSEDFDSELTLSEIKPILKQLQASGCIRIVFSGGDPLIRQDFLDIYLFAKKTGFLVDIFTSAFNLTDKIISALKRFPPHCIEVTLNGITKNTYERITRKPGSFEVALKNINKLKQNNLPLVIKSNCLTFNKNEITQIKSFSKELFGPGSRRFRLDPIILPRLNGDESPCSYRLSAQELRDIVQSDKELFLEHAESLGCIPGLSRKSEFMYQCSIWRKQFFINPFGRIKFCQFSQDFSLDLKQDSLSSYFSRLSEGVLNEKFKTDSKCRDCRLRPFCYNCPARAHLETASKEEPVKYFCELARSRKQEFQELINA